MAPLSCTPTRSTLPHCGAAAPTECTSPRDPAFTMETGRPRVLSHPNAQTSTKGHVEASVSLLAAMVAELSPDGRGVGPYKGHGDKETDSLSREKKGVVVEGKRG